MRVTLTSNADQIVAGQQFAAANGARSMRNVTTRATLQLKERLKAVAPVGPPRRKDYDEGDFRRSIKHSLVNQGGVRTGTVYSESPYAFRLEYGFIGKRETAGKYVPPGRYYANWRPLTPAHIGFWSEQTRLMEAQLPTMYAQTMTAINNYVSQFGSLGRPVRYIEPRFRV